MAQNLRYPKIILSLIIATQGLSCIALNTLFLERNSLTQLQYVQFWCACVWSTIWWLWHRILPISIDNHQIQLDDKYLHRPDLLIVLHEVEVDRKIGIHDPSLRNFIHLLQKVRTVRRLIMTTVQRHIMLFIKIGDNKIYFSVLV